MLLSLARDAFYEPFSLLRHMPGEPQVGETRSFSAECDKRFEACKLSDCAGDHSLCSQAMLNSLRLKNIKDASDALRCPALPGPACKARAASEPEPGRLAGLQSCKAFLRSALVKRLR